MATRYRGTGLVVPHDHPEVMNLLDAVMVRRCRWRRGGDGLVVLEPERFHRPWSRKLACFLDFKMRRKVRLDVEGSAVWTLCDGKRTLGEVAGVLEVRFGEDQNSVSRLAFFVHLLETNGLAEVRHAKRRAGGPVGARPADRWGGGRVRQ